MVTIDIDMPCGCGECIFIYDGVDAWGDYAEYCFFNKNLSIIPDVEEKAEWCPLREIKNG